MQNCKTIAEQYLGLRCELQSSFIDVDPDGVPYPHCDVCSSNFAIEYHGKPILDFKLFEVVGQIGPAGVPPKVS